MSLPTVRSAPSSSGRWPSGVAVVLSTATSAPAAWAAARDRGDVADVQQRVARRLQEHQPDAVAGRRRPRPPRSPASPRSRRARRTAPARRGPAAGSCSSRPTGRTTLSPGADAGEHGGADRRHPGGEGQAAAAVELADGRLELAQRRVLGARVGVGAAGRAAAGRRGGTAPRTPARAAAARPGTASALPPRTDRVPSPQEAELTPAWPRGDMISFTMFAGDSPSWQTAHDVPR